MGIALDRAVAGLNRRDTQRFVARWPPADSQLAILGTRNGQRTSGVSAANRRQIVRRARRCVSVKHTSDKFQKRRFARLVEAVEHRAFARKVSYRQTVPNSEAVELNVNKFHDVASCGLSRSAPSQATSPWICRTSVGVMGAFQELAALGRMSSIVQTSASTAKVCSSRRK